MLASQGERCYILAVITDCLSLLPLFSRDLRLFLITGALVALEWDGMRAMILNLYLLRLGYRPAFVGLVNGLPFVMGATSARERNHAFSFHNALLISAATILFWFHSRIPRGEMARPILPESGKRATKPSIPVRLAGAPLPTYRFGPSRGLPKPYF